MKLTHCRQFIISILISIGNTVITVNIMSKKLSKKRNQEGWSYNQEGN